MDARGWSIVSHCHDEITIEVPENAFSEQNMLAIMLEAPAWAIGLPLGGKVHSGPIYFEGRRPPRRPRPKRWRPPTTP
jgi:DNA polymerase